jgi:hypothetical protein
VVPGAFPMLGMLIERMRKRLSADRASFIEPCLPSPAGKPPSGSNWIHEIKHDGFRLIAYGPPSGLPSLPDVAIPKPIAMANLLA